jgi:hypothetical protein
MKINLFKWCNCFACASGIAWAYTSYKYDWLNVGGGESGLKEFWIAASGVVPYVTLSVWLAAVFLVAAQGRRGSYAVKNRTYRVATTSAIAPVALFIADWVFHIGFPKSLF